MPRRVAVSIGPEHGTVGPNQVKEAAKEAVQGLGHDTLVVCGFAFDPHVSEEVKRYGALTVLAARMNPDLVMGDPTPANPWLCGEAGNRRHRFGYRRVATSGEGQRRPMTSETTKTAAYYRQLPYTRRVRHVEEDTGESYFVAYIEVLGGLEADGDTPSDALANLADAFQDYIAAMLEWRELIPEPEVWPASLGWKTVAGRPTSTVDIGGFEPNAPDAPPEWVAAVPEVATAGSRALGMALA